MNKILIGYLDIGSNFEILCKAFKRRNHHVDTLFLTLNGRSTDIAGVFYQFLLRTLYNSKFFLVVKSGIRYKFITLILAPLRIFIFFYIFFRYHTYLMVASSRLLPFHLDYFLLSAFGKRVIASFHGSESRPPIISGKYANKKISHDIIIESKKLYNDVRRIERCVSIVISTPPQSHYLSDKFVNAFKIGKPIDLDDFSFVNQDCEIDSTDYRYKPLKVVHIPSHDLSKGSDIIRCKVNELHAEGLIFDFRVVSGVTRGCVIDEIAQADLVVDQIYSDSPIPNITKETGFLGKPVLLCGYYSDYLYDHMYVGAEFGVMLHPNEFKDQLRRLISDLEYRKHAALKLRRFVEISCDMDRIVSIYSKLFNNICIDDDLYFNPADNKYMLGCGVSKERLRTIINWLDQNHNEHASYLNPVQLTQLKMAVSDTSD